MQSKQNKLHIPVLLNQVITNLIVNKNGVYIDATLGLGGHCKEILKNLSQCGRIIGLDKDSHAIDIVKKSISDTRLTVFNTSYTQIPQVLKKLKIEKVDGILFDLGLSSLQLDSKTRGFSFKYPSPLDMRFNKYDKLTAEDIINKYGIDKLENIFQVYGEEKNYKKIARAIVEARIEKKIKTSKQLADLITSILPKRGRIHPATKVFQALRMEVNSELENIKEISNIIKQVLSTNGRVCIISFHSIEDRIIKHSFKDLAKQGDWKILNKKVIVPKYNEIKVNPRARSAKLRLIEKIV